MNSQISFFDGTYSLIHLPLSLYGTFLQPILQVLLPDTPARPAGATPTPFSLGLTPDRQHTFFNVSVTPLECSVVCHTAWAERAFHPAIAALAPAARARVSVSEDSYLVVSVISAGADPAGRVLELSAPLADAGIPIFFIATYFSDFMLVPARERANVISALVARGFDHAENDGGEPTFRPNPSSQFGLANQPSPSPPASAAAAPATARSGLEDLQRRTFETLRREGVVPRVEPGLRLVQCAGRALHLTGTEFAIQPAHLGWGGGGGGGRRRNGNRNGNRNGGDGGDDDHDDGDDDAARWSEGVDPSLYLAIVSALAAAPTPRFLSVTLAQEDPPSLLMDKELQGLFGNVVVGDSVHEFVPLMLDLEKLPFEATGIVCGVAGKLITAMDLMELSQLSYLSTARAGTVVMSSDQADGALAILNPLLGGGEGDGEEKKGESKGEGEEG